MNPNKIEWNSKGVTWDNFTRVDHIYEGYDASMFSEITYPSRIHSKNDKVYAYMNPKYSQKVADTSLDDQLLKHEQYHFNITEYHARKLRHKIVSQANTSNWFIREIYDNIINERDLMQTEYDDESDHNIDYFKQRFWELKIDDKLREESYYKNPNLYGYYNIVKSNTQYYKHVYYTFNHDIYKSYPVLKKDFKHGETYKVEENDYETNIYFYKNGKLNTNSYFNSHIKKIIRKQNDTLEIHYLDETENFNKKLERCKTQISHNNQGHKTLKYFDHSGNRVSYKGVFQVVWNRKSEKIWYSTYYNEKGEEISNQDFVYHEKKTLDQNGYSVFIEAYDQDHQPILDKDLVHKYDFYFDENHKVTRYKLFNTKNEWATYLGFFNVFYTYDERGNNTKVEYLDKDNMPLEDNSSVATYKYLYDISDNIIDEKRYNSKQKRVIGYEDYFQKVIDYDSLNRKTYQGNFYPGYVLAFDDNLNGANKYEYPTDSTSIAYSIDGYNNLFENNNGVAMTHHTYDKKRNIIKKEFWDEKGHLAKTPDGITHLLYKYDKNNNLIHKASYNKHCELEQNTSGIAITKHKYDIKNNRIESINYSAPKKNSNSPQISTHYKYEYNSKNKVVKQTHFDTKKNPYFIEGTYKYEYYSNAYGNDTLIKKFDLYNKPIKIAPVVRFTFNKFQQKIKESYLDKNLKSTINKDGISEIIYSYDSLGRQLGYRYLDTKGSITNNIYGIASQIKTMTKSGYISKYEHFNAGNNPVEGISNYHKIEYTFDENDFVIKESIFDVEGNLKNNSYGIATYKYEYFPSSIAKKITYLDADGNLYEDSSGIASVVYQQEINGLYYIDHELDKNGEKVNEHKEIESDSL